MTTLEDIQKRAAALSAVRDQLGDLLATMQAGIDAVKTDSMPGIRALARRVARQHNDLAALIAAHPGLFEKPRTHVVDGLKFGLQKQKGSMSWGDDEALCKRLRQLGRAGVLTPEQVSMCIRTKESPVAAALEKLDANVIKRLGITVAADTDAALIKSVDNEVEKAVNAVIREATKDANAEVAA
jgi:hypothetical protein